jgi:hypothetical protein
MVHGPSPARFKTWGGAHDGREQGSGWEMDDDAPTYYEVGSRMRWVSGGMEWKV